MERRKFMQQSLLAGGSLLAASNVIASEKKQDHWDDSTAFKCNYAIHDGMFNNLAGRDFIEQLKFAYSVGFRAMEDNGMMDRTPAEQQKIGDAMAKLGMTMGVFVINYDNWPLSVSMTSGDKTWREKFVTRCKMAVEVAKRTNTKYMTVVPGNYDHTKSLDFQLANVIDTLRRGTEILEKENLVMVLEPLSDTPELFLRRSDQSFALCRSINSPSCKILFDMYHMQRNQGDMIPNINRAWDEISYFQIGDNPGRNEPGTGEINYKNVFKHIHNKGYKGVLGMEHGIHGQGKDGEIALIKAYREADSF
ncbi:MAG: TIM barrel protein [Bacteroidetes bacterium]|nr:TIM barrel protein [Bacteroidota bacterium]